MSEKEMGAIAERAVRNARAAWTRAHRGMGSNPMTQTAAIPGVGAIAASLLTRLEDDDETQTEMAVAAIRAARAAWERTADDSPSNPIARTAEKAVIGILAAGLLNCRSPESRD